MAGISLKRRKSPKQLTNQFRTNFIVWIRIGLTCPLTYFLGKAFLSFQLHNVWENYPRPTCPWHLTYWPEYKKGSSNHQGLSTYQVWSFWCKVFLSYQLHKVWEPNMTFDLSTWISTGIIYWLWTIYLPSLKLLGQSVLELSVAQG